MPLPADPVEAGGRPLRRRREPDADIGAPRLRGTVVDALQAFTDHRCYEWMPLPADSLEGVRSVGAVNPVQIYGRPGLQGTAVRIPPSEPRTPNPKRRGPLRPLRQFSSKPDLDAPVLFPTIPGFVCGHGQGFSVAGDERRSNAAPLQFFPNRRCASL